MPQQPSLPPIEKSVQLIVEGKEDERFFKALLRHIELADIQVMPIGGKTKLPENLKALHKASGFHSIKSLAFIRDADDNPAGAFQSVCSALMNLDLPVPKSALTTVGGNLRVTIMILPDGKTPGMLEDICLQSIADAENMTCVSDFFECLEDKAIKIEPHEMSKARLQVYLASIKPEIRLGEAAEKGLWDWNHEAFTPLKTFLRQIAAE